MAEPAHDYTRGEMDIHEQKSTFDLFMGLTKWGSLYTAALVLFLSVWLAAGLGFVAGAVSAVVLIAVGYFSLKKKPGSDAAH